jgi:DcuC family C4-dicarboxylate transporter
MQTFLMYFISALSIAAIVVMLLKKMDIKITLLAVGILLIVAAMILGKKAVKTPTDFLLPIEIIANQFKKTLPAAGFIILILGGYSAYMSSIGANDVTVNTLTRPLKKIKSSFVLVPLVFLMGNFLSLVVPSASNLAIILLATLYPVLKKAGMSTLTAAAVIATTATIMPTPLGADNIAITQELIGNGYAITVSDYVFKYHVVISAPTLLLMAIIHYVWQKKCDKHDMIKENPDAGQNVTAGETKEIEGGTLYKCVYTILPLFPIVLLLAVYCINISLPPENKINLSVEVASLLSFLAAIISELIRRKNAKVVLEGTESFFKGMGSAMGIVALLVSAGVFVAGLTEIGVMAHLQNTMQHTSAPGFTLPLILVLFTALIVLLSGSGTALFYAMVPLMLPLATAAGISVLAVSIPMGLAGNLLRAVSPVSAVIVIVAGSIKENPVRIVKRTAVPMLAGTVCMFILSMVLFLSGTVSL